MLKQALLIILLIVTSNSLLAQPVSWPCQRTVTSRFSANQPPYSYLNDSGTLTGYRVELIQTVFKHLGCELKIETDTPWKRALLLVESGQVDVLINASVSAERLQYAHFSVPYEYDKMALYGRVGDVETIALNQLSDLTIGRARVGIIRGNYYGEEFARRQQSPQLQRRLVEVIDKDQLYSLLLMNRIDLYLDYFPNGNLALQATQLDDKIKRHPLPPVPVGSVHFMFSKVSVSPELVKKVDEVLLQFQQDGTLLALQQKYGLAE